MGREGHIELGDRIRRARKAAGFTQTELALIVGADQTTLSGYEHARSRPSSATVAAIEKACGIEPGTLAAGLDLPETAVKPASFEERLTATTAEVVALRAELSEVTRLVAELQTALSKLAPPARQGRPPRP